MRRFLVILFSAGAAAADGGVATFTDASLGPTSVRGAIPANSTIFGLVLDSFTAAPKRSSAPESIVDSTIGCGCGREASDVPIGAWTGTANVCAATDAWPV